MTATSDRKLSHLEICIHDRIEAHRHNGLDDFHFVHRAVCDLDYDDLDTAVTLWGKRLALPLLAAAMTGGHPEVREINEAIARSSQKTGFAIGIGSQRAAIEDHSCSIADSFHIVRDLAPDALLIANLGAAQFSTHGKFGKAEMERAVRLVEAQALAIHVNPAQELVQPEGDLHFQGFFRRIDEFAAELPYPVILKEVGSGFCREDAVLVEKSALAGIDVGGLGGTSWVAVEGLRAKKNGDQAGYQLSEIFWDWGLPTAIAVVESRSGTTKTLIATGGVRNGLEAAKLIAMGADIVGMALPFLQAAYQGQEKIEQLVRQFQRELKMAMFLTGCRNLHELRAAPLVVTGESREWMRQRGIAVPMPWRQAR